MEALPVLLSVRQRERYSANAAIGSLLTLRNLCSKYREAGGWGWQDTDGPLEMSGAVQPGQMCRLQEFHSNVGMPREGNVRCYDIRYCTKADDLRRAVYVPLCNDVNRGMLWCGAYEQYALTSLTRAPRTPGIARKCLQLASEWRLPTLTFYSCHAHYEARRSGTRHNQYDDYGYLGQVTPVTGLIGTLHNNTSVDMRPDEERGVPSVQAREFRPHHMAFLCAAHTSHSHDAGIARRLTCGVVIRLVCQSTLSELEEIMKVITVSGERDADFILFIMGAVLTVSHGTMCAVWNTVADVRCKRPHSVSVYCNRATRIAIVDLWSGAALKRSADGMWSTVAEMHCDVHPVPLPNPLLSAPGQSSLEMFVSPFFCLVPYTRHDRPPRPLTSSVQLQQAVCCPWSAGTASVSPTYVSRPLVMGELCKRIVELTDSSETYLADQIPGTIACTLFANFPENYEDSMMVSSRYADTGALSSTSLCHYVVSNTETIPPIGTYLCNVKHAWWKVPCHRRCSHSGNRVTPIIGSSECTGRVIGLATLDTGEIQVKVLSYSQLRTGDKISTWHGQKGVANIIRHSDMPIIHLDDGTIIEPDIVMAVSSVTNRQTNGQIVEACMNTQLLGEGNNSEVDSRMPTLESLAYICDGTTGEVVTTIVDGRPEAPALASWGYCTVFSQTQMVRDRQHATHLMPSVHAVSAPVGRSRGGPVRLGEMEVHAMASVGMSSCAAELMSRTDMIECDVCTQCRRLRVLCPCEGGRYVSTIMPYGTYVFDVTSAATHDIVNVYDLEPESM